MTYKRKGQNLLRVRGYKEKGNIDTPLELAIRNETDRYSLAILAIDSLKSVLGNKGSSTREYLLNTRTAAVNYAYETGLALLDIYAGVTVSSIDRVLIDMVSAAFLAISSSRSF
jgi:phosphoketolase